MKASEFRANAAGYLDSANTLVSAVRGALTEGEKMLDERHLKRIEVPPPVYVVLDEISERLHRVAGWLLDPSNADLEK